MITTVTTFVLAAAMAAFAFYAVALNEAGHAARRRAKIAGLKGRPRHWTRGRGASRLGRGWWGPGLP